MAADVLENRVEIDKSCQLMTHLHNGLIKSSINQTIASVANGMKNAFESD